MRLQEVLRFLAKHGEVVGADFRHERVGSIQLLQEAVIVLRLAQQVLVQLCYQINLILEFKVHTFEANGTVFTLLVFDDCVELFLFLGDLLLIEANLHSLRLAQVFEGSIELLDLGSEIVDVLVLDLETCLQLHYDKLFGLHDGLVILEVFLKIL